MSSDVEANVTKNDNTTLRNENYLKNPRNYVLLASKRNQAHQSMALCWEKIYYVGTFSLIVLTSISTVLAVIEDKIPYFVLPIVAGLSALISSLMAVLKPQDKQKSNLEAARRFKILMLKFVSCENMTKYKRVRQEIQDELMDAPFTYRTYPLREQKQKSNSGNDLTDGPPANNSEREGAISERKEVSYKFSKWIFDLFYLMALLIFIGNAYFRLCNRGMVQKSTNVSFKVTNSQL